ncbi:MAG TPA: hypothetical protein VNU95_05900 [Candidatus Acidoferrales bacterium]|nr:hypothetical protein [Candidatus Acidoferrales bacterium]
MRTHRWSVPSLFIALVAFISLTFGAMSAEAAAGGLSHSDKNAAAAELAAIPAAPAIDSGDNAWMLAS